MSDDLVKKYELTSDSIRVAGRTLYRVEAVRDFARVRRGYKGGFVESEANLSHSSNAWVFDNAKVYGNAQVLDNARVLDNAKVFGNAMVSDKAKVFDNAWVFDNAKVSENAKVYGNAMVSDKAKVFGNARVLDNARVYGNAWVYGNARVYGNAKVFDNAKVYGNARVFDKAKAYGNAQVSRPICAATRSDGYTFIVAPDAAGQLRVIAGCRYFSFDEARTHWIVTRGGTRLGDETMQILDHLEAMAKIRQGNL